MNCYVITGATGFLGKALVARLYTKEPNCHIIVISRSESKLLALKSDYPNLTIIPGDIARQRDLVHAVRRASTGITGIFHLAAYKHVGLSEVFPATCSLTNVMGTINTLDLAKDISAGFIIGISTDKAAQVSGVYGASKLIMESLFKEYEIINPLTEHRIVRYGNVLYSTGSVLCKWKDLLQKGEGITITDPNATRFFWTRDQAVDLIFECLAKAKNAQPWVPEMKAMRIQDLAQAMIKKYATKEVPIKIIGLQPGENLHEKIMENGPDSSQVESYSIEEITQLI